VICPVCELLRVGVFSAKCREFFFVKESSSIRCVLSSCAKQLYLYTGIQIECIGQWLHYLSCCSAAVISLQNVALSLTGYDHNSEQAVQGCKGMITLPCTQASVACNKITFA